MIDVKTCRDINGSRVKIGDIVGQINYDKDITRPHCVVERITKEGYFITIHTDKGKIFTKQQLLLMHTKQ